MPNDVQGGCRYRSTCERKYKVCRTVQAIAFLGLDWIVVDYCDPVHRGVRQMGAWRLNCFRRCQSSSLVGQSMLFPVGLLSARMSLFWPLGRCTAVSPGIVSPLQQLVPWPVVTIGWKTACSGLQLRVSFDGFGRCLWVSVRWRRFCVRSIKVPNLGT